MDLDSTVRLGLLRLQQADGVWSFLKNSIYYKNIHRGDFKEQCIQNNTNANGATHTRTHTRQTHSKIITSRLAGVEPGTEVETKCGRVFPFVMFAKISCPLPSHHHHHRWTLLPTLCTSVWVVWSTCWVTPALTSIEASHPEWENRRIQQNCVERLKETHKKTKIPGLPVCLTQCLKHDINLSDQPERKRRPRQTHLYVCIYTEQGWKSCRAKNTRAEGRAQRSCWTQSRQTWFISSLDSTICFSGWKSGPRR